MRHYKPINEMTDVADDLRIYFTDYFAVTAEDLAEYGTFNVSLHSDLPLFIDPFLLFNSTREDYRALHDGIIRYVAFLRDKSAAGVLHDDQLRAWFTFSEVGQTWLGFSRTGNRGRGLGMKFARALNRNLNTIFASFGKEKVTQGSHIEKLCLIEDGVGRDNISDFTTNLIKEHLLEFTQTFARQYLPSTQRKRYAIAKVRFNYTTESWESVTYELPSLNDDYVVLCPLNLLTKDDTWINRGDLIHDYEQITESVPSGQLRAQINNYFLKVLPEQPTELEWRDAVARVYREFPELIEYFIRLKEDNGDRAQALSDLKVALSNRLYVKQVREFSNLLNLSTPFYSTGGNTYEEAHQKVAFLKGVIENKGGWRLFYIENKPVKREDDVQILFRLTWHASPSSVTREANDGRGPVDFKISRGAKDQTLLEFKLASNSQLRRNLQHQAEIYKAASDADRAIKVIVFFTDSERERVQSLLRDLGLENERDVVMIDARSDNKISASKATSH
jgi:FMN phosphatase YigB (HAD superfamily)